jgi:hypothetical protein
MITIAAITMFLLPEITVAVGTSKMLFLSPSNIFTGGF